jgi:putative ABC transport system permease protein
MLKNQILIAIRNLSRHRGYSFINIGGLTIGIASCLLILLFVTSELGYDRYHEKSNRIYRIGIEAVFGDSHFFSAYTSGAMKDALDYEIGEVEESSRLFHITRPVIRVGNRNFLEDNFFYADSCFFRIFTVPLLKGDAETALSRPNTVVLSEETAGRLFGSTDPVGETIWVNENYLMEITGVARNMPNNSHFRFDFLASIATIIPDQRDNFHYWVNNNMYTYVLLAENTDPVSFDGRLQDLVYTYVAPEVEMVMGINIEAFEMEGGVYRFFTERLEDIHLHSRADHQINEGGSLTAVYFFSVIAIFILVIACINFMNLATARFSNRAKEIGVRKTLGSSRGNLVRQFLVESVFISLISMVVAITLLELSLPFFNKITYKSFELNYFAEWYIVPGLILFSLITGILAGSYPAFFLSSFNPVKVLKGETSAGKRGIGLRKTLVVAQFTITLALLISTFIVSAQLNFIQSNDPGYAKEGLMVLKRTQILGDQQEAFRNELLSHESIINASFCSALPGYSTGGTSIHRNDAPAEELVQIMILWADEHYLETMGMRLAEGRFFSSEYSTDTDATIINRPLARALGFNESLSAGIMYPGQDLSSPVIGVLEDVNFESLHRNIRPLAIRQIGSPGWLMAIRVDGSNISRAIAHVEEQWKLFAGDAPFVWSFLEEDLLQLYTQEIRTRSIFEIFAMLAIFVAALGLLGMASFNTEKRTREIGIRKAMGASPLSIIRLLSGEINLLVAAAALISWPAAWFLMNRWLDNFAYRIDPGLASFLAATLLTYFIALLTVGIQSWRAANLNPVDILRNE